MDLPFSFKHRLLLAGYELLWFMGLPLLALHPRTGPGLKKRKDQKIPPREVDVWVQAASTGEAALTAELVSAWPKDRPGAILATTSTPQGMDILKQIELLEHLRLIRAFCPLDNTRSVDRFLRAFRPKLMVLLETELWPGILTGCKKANIPVLILNGRMTATSLARYLPLQGFWQALAPTGIKALDPEQAMRFRLLFPDTDPGVIPNIKFDRNPPDQFLNYADNPLAPLFKPQNRLIVLGSVRRQEEPLLIGVIAELLQKRPNSILALFPRHLTRVESWKILLDGKGLKWVLRSAIKGQVKQGTVVLWDTFGELLPAYSLAGCAFVGGSLARLGGQNFLEPLSQGVVPCIGPFWNNFSWIGREIVDQGLVKEVHTPLELGDCLLETMKASSGREKIQAEFAGYIKTRQGGARQSVETILSWLDKDRPAGDDAGYLNHPHDDNTLSGLP